MPTGRENNSCCRSQRAYNMIEQNILETIKMCCAVWSGTRQSVWLVSPHDLSNLTDDLEAYPLYRQTCVSVISRIMLTP